MAKQIVARLEVVPTDSVAVNTTIHQMSPLDAIHQATCMLEHLAEVTGLNAEGAETNASFGQYLLLNQIAEQLRVSINQILDERAARGDAGRACRALG